MILTLGFDLSVHTDTSNSKFGTFSDKCFGQTSLKEKSYLVQKSLNVSPPIMKPARSRSCRHHGGGKKERFRRGRKEKVVAHFSLIRLQVSASLVCFGGCGPALRL